MLWTTAAVDRGALDGPSFKACPHSHGNVVKHAETSCSAFEAALMIVRNFVGEP